MKRIGKKVENVGKTWKQVGKNLKRVGENLKKVGIKYVFLDVWGGGQFTATPLYIRPCTVDKIQSAGSFQNQISKCPDLSEILPPILVHIMPYRPSTKQLLVNPGVVGEWRIKAIFVLEVAHLHLYLTGKGLIKNKAVSFKQKI